MSPKPSTLLLEMRAAIQASGLSNRAIARLTNGYPAYDAVRDIRLSDDILPNRGTVEALARALSRSPRVVEYWHRRSHPVGDECVAYWSALHAQARESRRAKVDPSTDELPQPPSAFSQLVSLYRPLSEYCD